MINGAIILESLSEDARLDNLALSIRELYRFRPPVTAPGHPPVWSVIEFEAPETSASPLAQALTDVLSEQPGWYVEFRSPTETFIVFRGKYFRYPRGDNRGRAEAQEYGRLTGTPESQLDWPS
jgi:hypothetical protein